MRKECDMCGEGFRVFAKTNRFCSRYCYSLSKNKQAQLRDTEIRALNNELGRCYRCAGERDNPKFLSCFKCRLKKTEYYYKRKNDMQKM